MDPSTVEGNEARMFAHLVHERRATRHFRPDPVSEETIATALAIAGEAPSGDNFQPWRFLVLTGQGQRDSLKAAAFNQEKISEAPVVIVAFGQRAGWKTNVDEILRSSAERRGLPADSVDKQKRGALGFVDTMDPAVWLNRHVMIAFTHLMLAFEAVGGDTAPMEEFDGSAVKRACHLPDDAEVVALLAVGRARDPQPHPGRLGVDQIAFHNRIDAPFHAESAVIAAMD